MKLKLLRALAILASVVAASSLLEPRADAGVEGSTMLREYQDGQTTVTSPAVEVEGTFNRDTMKVGAGFTQDVVSSASADVRTFGSKGVNSRIYENRKEFSGRFDANVPDGSLGAGYIQSDENDYHSKIVSASGSRELFQKNLTLGLGFANGQDEINSSADPSFSRAMNHQVYSLSASQVLSKESIVQLSYDFRVENGFLASPYRRAKIDPGDGSGIESRAENHPLTRNRNAIALKYNRYFRSVGVSTSTGYRYYLDSWDVRSHTIEERITKELGSRFATSLTLRYYTQTQANFYQNYYSSNPGPFYTGNVTLATYSSYSIALRPEWKPTDKLSVYLRAEVFYQNFQNATESNTLVTRADDNPLVIRAQVFGAGLTARF